MALHRDLVLFHVFLGTLAFEAAPELNERLLHLIYLLSEQHDGRTLLPRSLDDAAGTSLSILHLHDHLAVIFKGFV